MGHILVEIGKRIAESRRNAGFTQEELANRLGVTPQALSKWEKGASSPDLEMLTSLCDILEVSADYPVGKKRKTIVENGNLIQQDEIWKHLWDGYQPLELVFGNDVVPAFMEKPVVEKIVQVRVELAKEGILEDFLKQNRAEAIKVSIYEYNEELHLATVRREGYEDGLVDGLERGISQGIAQGITPFLKST